MERRQRTCSFILVNSKPVYHMTSWHGVKATCWKKFLYNTIIVTLISVSPIDKKIILQTIEYIFLIYFIHAQTVKRATKWSAQANEPDLWHVNCSTRFLVFTAVTQNATTLLSLPHSIVGTTMAIILLFIIVLCCIISYHLISHLISSYHIISHHIISYNIISYHIIPYQINSKYW